MGPSNITRSAHTSNVIHDHDDDHHHHPSSHDASAAQELGSVGDSKRRHEPASPVRFLELFMTLEPDLARELEEAVEKVALVQTKLKEKDFDANLHLMIDAGPSENSDGKALVACLFSCTLPNPGYPDENGNLDASRANGMDTVSSGLILARHSQSSIDPNGGSPRDGDRQRHTESWRKRVPPWYPSVREDPAGGFVVGRTTDSACEERLTGKNCCAPELSEGQVLDVPKVLRRLAKPALVTFYSSLMRNLHAAAKDVGCHNAYHGDHHLARENYRGTPSQGQGILVYGHWTPSNAPDFVRLSRGDGTSEIVRILRANESAIMSKNGARARAANSILATIAYLSHASPLIAQAVEEQCLELR